MNVSSNGNASHPGVSDHKAALISDVSCSGRPLFFDRVMIRESIPLSSILKLSDDELTEVCVACGVASNDEPDSLLQEQVKSQHFDIVIMTRAANGAVMVTSDGIVEPPGIPTIVRNTVGKGDSFTAAFLLGRQCGESHDQSLFDCSRGVFSFGSGTSSDLVCVPQSDSRGYAFL